MKRISIAFAAFCGLATFATSTGALASGFAVRDTSAESVGMVGAGNGSRADNLDTIFNNPAGMTQFDGNQIEFGALLVRTNIDFSGSDTLAGMPINGPMGSAGRFGGVPDLYALYSVTDRLKLGLAVTAPFGLLVKYNQPWIGRYLGTEGNVLSVDLNPNIAYRVLDWLSVGGGVSAQFIKARLATSVNQAAILTPLLGPAAAGISDAGATATASDWGVGYNFGILVQPLPQTLIGVTYRSKVDHTIVGRFETTNVSPFLAGVLVSDRNEQSPFNVPATIGLSITQQIDPVWSVSADLQRTQWSVFKTVTITDRSTGALLAPPLPSGFQDTWAAEVGASYRFSDQWTLRGGVGYDETPIPDHFRSVFLPDQSRIMVGIGASYKWNEQITADFGYAHFFAAGNTPITGSVNSVDRTTGSVLTGNFDVSLDVVAASLRIKF